MFVHVNAWIVQYENDDIWRSDHELFLIEVIINGRAKGEHRCVRVIGNYPISREELWVACLCLLSTT